MFPESNLSIQDRANGVSQYSRFQKLVRLPGMLTQLVYLGVIAVSFGNLSPIQAQLFKTPRFFEQFKRPDPLPTVFRQTPSQQELMNLFDRRLQSVRQLESNVSISMTGMPTKIKGTLQVEYPSRMRLTAGVMGVSQLGIDVGTNESDFWIWIKAGLPGQPPAFYFANQQAFKSSPIYQSLPLDPNWLINALGLIRLGPEEQHIGPRTTRNGLEIFSVRQTPSGRLVNYRLIHPQTGLVIQQAVYNSKNQRLAYTDSVEYRTYQLPSGGGTISLPHLIRVHMTSPQGGDEMMEVRLSKFSIDSLYGNAAKMWAMPQPPNDVQKVNLTQQGTSVVGAEYSVPQKSPSSPSQGRNPFRNAGWGDR